MIEVKVDEDIVFIEKKYIKVGILAKAPEKELDKSSEVIDDNESHDVEKIEFDLFDPEKPEDDEEKTEKPVEALQDRLRKTLEELEGIKQDMKNTFTSTETISSTVTSIKGMIDALRKDQLEIQESMKIDESIVVDVKKNIQDFRDMQIKLIDSGENAIEKDKNGSPIMIEETKKRIDMSKEWLKRSENVLKISNLGKALMDEKDKSYPDKTPEDKFINKIWFDSLKFWLHVSAKMN